MFLTVSKRNSLTCTNLQLIKREKRIEIMSFQLRNNKDRTNKNEDGFKIVKRQSDASKLTRCSSPLHYC